MDEAPDIGGIVDAHMESNAASSIGGAPPPPLPAPPPQVADPDPPPSGTVGSANSAAAPIAATPGVPTDLTKKQQIGQAISSGLKGAGAIMSAPRAGGGVSQPGPVQVGSPMASPGVQFQNPSFAAIQNSPISGIQMAPPPSMAISDVRAKYNIMPGSQDMDALLNSVYKSVIGKGKK